MNIFYVAMASANNVVLRQSRIWESNLKQTLVQMGQNVIEPSFDSGDMAYHCMGRDAHCDPVEARAHYSSRLVADVAGAHRSPGIDLFLGYLYSAMILPDAIDFVKALGIPTVNFYCNNIHQFDLVSEIAPHFDYCMFPERDAEPLYRAVGANPVHIQMGANPQVYRPYELSRQYDVSFVGSRYLNRERYMAHLYHGGIECHAWGPGWDYAVPTTLRAMLGRLRRRCMAIVRGSPTDQRLPSDRRHPPLSDDELIRMYSRSKISLGFSEVRLPDGSLRRHIRLRDFEAPMSGALYFTGFQDELAEYYEIGKEVVCYDTQVELLDKVRYYLAHDSQAEKVRRAGLERARRDHTWENRFRQLFGVIGLRY